ncbi:hypothetical protein PROFUN_02663 [Planoprotostelium fungivorum]|uniref:Transmembrane protein n=1 Tax=Planoprotostelium fungivorum TaxID=1890364 RepID=A0A2P6NVH0_9EUKA|nr:hypothetical protein PROFUN_02663 [Planoprotostelium fungivorum]
MIEQYLWMVAVALVWGATNPLMKIGSRGVSRVAASSQGNVVSKFANEMKYLFTQWRYIGAFLLNQSGSILFYYTLSNNEISMVVPITNSLTFLFTTVSSHYILNEPCTDPGTISGMILIAVGVFICMSAKAQ